MSLELFGCIPFIQKQLADLHHADLGRVVAVHRGEATVVTETGPRAAAPSGKLLYAGDSLPAVGDWVALRGGAIDAVLPRRTVVARKSAGSETRQVLAANIDTLIIVCGLDGDFNVRRIERYLVLARESGADAAIVLNKSDLVADLAARIESVRRVASGAPVIAVSAIRGDGMAALDELLRPRKTGALIGSSGAGKSTIINALLGAEAIATRAVRVHDSRGKHTTTHRELFPLPSGALLIDMPGLREVGLWADESSLDTVFDDVQSLAGQCRFRDCRHQGEPGCAVAGAVDEDRLRSYRKLQREIDWLDRREDAGAQAAEKRRWKIIHKAMRKSKS